MLFAEMYVPTSLREERISESVTVDGELGSGNRDVDRGIVGMVLDYWR